MLCEYVLGGGTRSFNKHLAKKRGIKKETRAASASGTTSGSWQRTMAIPDEGMPFKYNLNEMIDELLNMEFLMSYHLIMVKVRLVNIALEKICNHNIEP